MNIVLNANFTIRLFWGSLIPKIKVKTTWNRPSRSGRLASKSSSGIFLKFVNYEETIGNRGFFGALIPNMLSATVFQAPVVPVSLHGYEYHSQELYWTRSWKQLKLIILRLFKLWTQWTTVLWPSGAQLVSTSFPGVPGVTSSGNYTMSIGK